MDRARQRKLEARRKRLESLHHAQSHSMPEPTAVLDREDKKKKILEEVQRIAKERDLSLKEAAEYYKVHNLGLAQSSNKTNKLPSNSLGNKQEHETTAKSTALPKK